MTQTEAYEMLESALYYVHERHPADVKARQILHGALRRLTMEMPVYLLENIDIPVNPDNLVTN